MATTGQKGKQRRWTMDFKPRQGTQGRTNELTSPPGFYSSSNDYAVTEANSRSSSGSDRDNQAITHAQLIVKKSWQTALGPVKQLPMQVLLMWLVGAGLGIMQIMMVFMLFLQPIRALFGAQQTFRTLEGDQRIVQCIVYVLGNLALLALAVYKCHSMGILPTHDSDWLSFASHAKQLEYSFGSVN